ncbi:MAG: Hsp20/alpha crystallin family protein [Bacilli bacterium]|nr:Hsp20/alpha crystallin family protein [Bacilli bacterium]
MLMPRRDFDLFDDFFRDDFFNGKEKNSLMKTDIREGENSFIVDVDLPGYNKEDIKIDVTNGYLTINAKTSNEVNDKEKGKYVRRERFIGECSRSFYVGDDVKQDEIKASFKNGILSLEIPKVDEKKKEAEKKYIEISD